MKFSTLGRCAKCGDQEGSWTLIDGLWLCDKCAGSKENEKIIDQIKKCDDTPGTPANDSANSGNAKTGRHYLR